MFLKQSRLKTGLGEILSRFGSPKGVVLGGLWRVKLDQKREGKVMQKKASSWPGLGGGWTRLPLGHFGPALIRGRPGYRREIRRAEVIF